MDVVDFDELVSYCPCEKSALSVRNILTQAEQH